MCFRDRELTAVSTIKREVMKIKHCALITATFVCKVAAVNLGTHTHTLSHTVYVVVISWVAKPVDSSLKFMKQLLFHVVLNSYQLLSRAPFVAFVIVVTK